MASVFQQLDSQIDQLLADWSIYSSLLVVVIGAYLVYPLIFYVEPEIHPYLLARQSTPSRVRQSGETPIYRALETPQGYPLKSGLNVKDPGQPKWTAGRDGDLRDVWRRACSGTPAGNDETSNGRVGVANSISGKEEVLEHSFEQLSKELNALGKHVKGHGSKRVGIYLSNSIELLVALMAASFYDFTPILIAQDQSLQRLATILEKTQADTLIAGGGSVSLKDLLKQYNGLKQVIWVVARSSRHVDWNEVSEGEGGKAEISTWHDIVDEQSDSASAELPAHESSSQAPNVTLVSEPTDKINDYTIVEFTQKNLVSAIAAQLSTLPRDHRFSPTDMVLPLAPLTKVYPLTLTLTALYSNTNIALTSVTGSTASYASAFQGISPTIIIADPLTLYSYEARQRWLIQNSFFATQRQNRLLSKLAKGAMPPRSAPPSGEGSPRLLYTWTINYPEAQVNLRACTGARIITAFTHPSVAGAVSQTNALDYRQVDHFGPPLSCVEVKLTEVPGRDIDGDEPQGKLVVTGPAVAGEGGSETLSVDEPVMKITESLTLAYGDKDTSMSGEKRDLPVPDLREHIEHALANPVAG